ncbi:MAG: hypothetical protein E6R03_13880 [Hyphomicrobiaceae bacterium]|nr:MAG: hypothetical protein E6R03_13880 [Hyphomicrobiaceae bacterium]
MELDDEAKADMAIPCGPCETGSTPKKLLPEYPWGLRITLGDAELTKLGIDIASLPIGAMVHLHALARVTSVGQDQRQDGSTPSRAELQIEQLATESEDEKNEEAEKAAPKPRARLRSVYSK